MNFDGNSANNIIDGDFTISGDVNTDATIFNHQSSTPDNPPSDTLKMYALNDDTIHVLDSAGNDTIIGVNVVNGTPADNEIARFDTNGNTLQGSNVFVDDAATIKVGSGQNSLAIVTGTTTIPAGYENLTYNVGIGHTTFDKITTGAKNNVAIGAPACFNLTIGTNNTVIGTDAGSEVTDGSNNTLIGYLASSGSGVSNSIAIGNGAQGSASDQITLGNASVNVMRPGGDNVMDLGASGRRFKDAYIGGTVDAAAYTVSGAATKPVIPFGTQSYGIGNSTATSGNFSLYIGDFAGETNTGGTNIAIGNATLRESTSSERNVAIGDSALRGVVGSELTGDRHVAIGQDALRNVTTVSEHNTAVGWSSGKNVSTGSGNVCMGYLSGDSITTGVSNTCIGYAADCAATGSNQTAIGNNAICDASNQITLGDVLVEVMRPGGDNVMDLGASGRRFKDAYLSGTMTAAQLNLGKVIYVKNDTETGSGFVGNTHAVINRAITALSGVGHIILGAGTYTFGAAVNLNNSSWNLHISGTSGTIISNSTTDAFVLTSGFTPKVRFSELEFQTASSNNSSCITNDGTGSELYVDNCKFTSTSAATSGQAAPLFIQDNVNTDPQGVTNISDCEFDLSAVLAAATGVVGANGRGKNHKWSKCVFIGTQSYDTILFDCTSLNTHDLSVSDCYFQDGIINWRNGAFTRFNNCTYVDTFITSRLNPGGTTDRYMLLNNCRFFMNTRSHPIVLFDGTEWSSTGARQAYMKFNACEFTPASGQPVFSLVRPGPAGNNFTLYLEVKNTLYGLPTLNVYDFGGSSTVTQASDNFVEYPKLDGVTVATAYTSNVPLGARAYDTARGWMVNTSSTPASPTWTPEITIIDGSSATLSGTVDAGDLIVQPTTIDFSDTGTYLTTRYYPVVVDPVLWGARQKPTFLECANEGPGNYEYISCWAVGSKTNDAGTDAKFFNLQITRTVESNANKFNLGIYRDISSGGNGPIAVYLQGGRRYFLRAEKLQMWISDGNPVVAAGSTYAIKDSTGADVVGTSVAIELSVDIYNLVEGFHVAPNQSSTIVSMVSSGIETTGSVKVGSFATGSLPSGTNGMIAYDSTTNQLKAYVNGAWTVVV